MRTIIIYADLASCRLNTQENIDDRLRLFYQSIDRDPGTLARMEWPRGVINVARPLEHPS